jgi:SAM-dependent methyltransferase
MRIIIPVLLALCQVWGQTPAPLSYDEVKKQIASFAPDNQVYELWRFWAYHQPPDVQKLFDQDSTKAAGYALYRKELERLGDSPAEIDRKIQVIDKDGERWEIERWNRILTSNSPRINWKPNAFLVEMVKGRKPGRALDVSMGQGRNALWLAQQGWDTTGYDPAEKAVALARETAAKVGVKVNTVIAKDSEFDMGTAKWDLILLSYADIRGNAEHVIRALAPGGIVVAEYFHDDPEGSPGGLADNELLKLFAPLRVLRYEDTEDIADFGLRKAKLVRLCAEKTATSGDTRAVSAPH